MIQLSWLSQHLLFVPTHLETGNYLGLLMSSLLLYLVVSSILNPLIAAFARAKQMHRIPCTQCCFFTNDYRLKCTVKPEIANTEAAIDCRDYNSLS